MKESEPAKVATTADAIEWKGALHKVSPERGLTIETWDYNSNQFFQLNTADSKNKPLSLNIFYLLTPGSLALVKKTAFKRKETERDTVNTFFVIGNTPVTFEVKTEKSFRALLLKIDTGWLCKELNTPGLSSEELTSKLMIEQSVGVNYSPNEYLLANKLYEHIATNNADKMFMISRAFLLLSDFFEKTFIKSTHLPSNIPLEYYDKMLQVESIIISSIKSKLPSLEEIAIETGMSESSLKRYFQKVFGNNIHEYYIAAKMDVAKRMLVEKNLSVTEVSEFLGYDKAKHFINNFKKYFSYLPSDILKSNHNFFSELKGANA